MAFNAINSKTATLQTNIDAKQDKLTGVGSASTPIYINSSGVPTVCNLGLGDAASRSVTSKVTQDSTALVTSGAVYTAINSMVPGYYVEVGVGEIFSTTVTPRYNSSEGTTLNLYPRNEMEFVDSDVNWSNSSSVTNPVNVSAHGKNLTSASTWKSFKNRALLRDDDWISLIRTALDNLSIRTNYPLPIYFDAFLMAKSGPEDSQYARLNTIGFYFYVQSNGSQPPLCVLTHWDSSSNSRYVYGENSFNTSTGFLIEGSIYFRGCSTNQYSSESYSSVS